MFSSLAIRLYRKLALRLADPDRCERLRLFSTGRNGAGPVRRAVPRPVGRERVGRHNRLRPAARLSPQIQARRDDPSGCPTAGTAVVPRAVEDLRGEYARNGTCSGRRHGRSTACAASFVSQTDKVYENREWEWAYRENDPIGGKDPYSASKAAAEMVIKGYAHSFMGGPDGPVVATARGGNIVGGGDWSQDRLVPDFVRAIVAKEGMTLRFPDATRPWQHVLALVQAYLMLSAGMLSDAPRTYARAWNFGPKGGRTPIPCET